MYLHLYIRLDVPDSISYGSMACLAKWTLDILTASNAPTMISRVMRVALFRGEDTDFDFFSSTNTGVDCCFRSEMVDAVALASRLD